MHLTNQVAPSSHHDGGSRQAEYLWRCLVLQLRPQLMRQVRAKSVCLPCFPILSRIMTCHFFSIWLISFFLLHPLRIPSDHRSDLLLRIFFFQLFGIYSVTSFILACLRDGLSYPFNRPALCHFSADDRTPEWTLLPNSIARNWAMCR